MVAPASHRPPDPPFGPTRYASKMLALHLPNFSPHHTQGVGIGGLFAAQSIAVFDDHVSFARRQKQIRLHPMLLGVQIIITAAHLIKFLVRATLDDLALLDYEDLVGAANGRQTVRDHKCSAPLHEV